MVAKEPVSAPADASAGDGDGSPERNRLAIVPSEEIPPPPPPPLPPPLSVESTRREEVETKISTWEEEEVSRIMNRFQRQKAIIDGWEGEQVEKASACLKKLEVIKYLNPDP
ncbi:hypothetical protein KSP40_PGU020420 [Platanthera guangdongensis]|uniref:Remorin C-terminal domain-containing protein n=1 Tax=Platanthera guangdongensis TaxID=2320717 RepID=A0ABR2LCG1_9ASPA